ncbi:gp16 family protein [Pseudomonas citronellolis]|uniref:gp16 family protein n=1 Tax=Pseudomonas citronellolis TaxID=53408 RepID=UPI0023E39714|nr:regulatory protein GemA [Pseudomonas citronellolis]MDF3931377.1 regulatory protein GemA [Pseudomonas citronellolis]
MSSKGRQLIQIARRQLGMDDDTYRAMLGRVAGVTSSTKLTPRQVGLVLAELERLGWEPARKTVGRAAPQVAPDRQALVSKIEAFLAEAERPWSYADAMALRMFQVERVEWLDAGQLGRLVAALAYDAKRHGRKV